MVEQIVQRKSYRTGKVARVRIVQQWTRVTGSEHECGISSSVTGILPPKNTPSGSLEVEMVKMMINPGPLFEMAATGKPVAQGHFYQYLGK